MKNETKFSHSVVRIAVATVLILLVPLVAMQISDEINWSVADFIIMGGLIFSIGFTYILSTRYVTNITYKIAIGFALGSMFLLIWANLAVGLIGGGPNPGNLMYMGVVVVGIIGVILSRLTPTGMERTLYATAIAVVLVGIIALVANMDEYPGSSVSDIIGVNGFFAILFAISGLLFRYAALKQTSQK